MATFTYNRDIPDGPHNPSADQGPMKVNTNSTDDLIKQDHYSFGQQNRDGWHKQVTMFDSVTPGPNGDLQLYSKQGGGRSVLWARNSGDDLPLFTGPALGAANGYTSMYGGMIVQWGVVTQVLVGGSTGTVTFATANIAFPNNLYTVFTQPLYTTTAPSSTGGMATVAIDSNPANTDKTKFKWTFITNSGAYTKFYWWAIGN